MLEILNFDYYSDLGSITFNKLAYLNERKAIKRF